MFSRLHSSEALTSPGCASTASSMDWQQSQKIESELSLQMPQYLQEIADKFIWPQLWFRDCLESPFEISAFANGLKFASPEITAFATALNLLVFQNSPFMHRGHLRASVCLPTRRRSSADSSGFCQETLRHTCFLACSDTSAHGSAAFRQTETYRLRVAHTRRPAPHAIGERRLWLRHIRQTETYSASVRIATRLAFADTSSFCVLFRLLSS